MSEYSVGCYICGHDMRMASVRSSAFELLCSLTVVVQFCNGDYYGRSMASQSERGDVSGALKFRCIHQLYARCTRAGR